MNTAIALALFLGIFSWFLSYYKNPAIRFASAVLLLICGFAAETMVASIVYRGGDISLLIANFAIMLAFFAVSIRESSNTFYTLLDKLKKTNNSAPI